MKKVLGALLVVIMLFSFSACGDSKDEEKSGTDEKKVEKEAKDSKDGLKYGFYETEIPKGYKEKDENSYKDTYWIDESQSPKRKIQILASSFNKTAEEEAASSLDYDDRKTAGEDVEFAGYTWKVVNFKWDDDLPSATYYADINGRCVEVNMFCLTAEEDAGKTFMENLKFVDGDLKEKMHELNKIK